MIHTSWRAGLVVPALLLALSGCNNDGGSSDSSPTPATPTTASDTPTVETPTLTPTPTSTSQPLCDPGFGLPKDKVGCPDPEPETAWLSKNNAGQLVLKPFRSFTNDAQGKAYAKKHGLEYPFPNDVYDAPSGPAHPLELGPDTVCTGIILVGYQDPLADHVVNCAKLVRVASRQGVTVAVWSVGPDVIQVSELFRP
jgi:hypothetical protein